MTTPGGVPNLPMGALILDTLATNLQDMSGTAMKSRAVARFPSIFDGSTGLSPASDLTPFGILTRIWAEVNSLVATADPADIQGPEDLPPLVLQFIEGLPFVGQFVDLFAAITGTYTGDDPTLLSIQQVFGPILLIVDTVFNALTGAGTTGNSLADLTSALQNINPGNIGGVGGPADIGSSLLAQLDALVGGATGTPGTGASNADAFNIFKSLGTKAGQGSNAWEVQGERNNTPTDSGPLPSSESNYNYTIIDTTLTATPTASLITVMRVQRSAPLGWVDWIGCGTAGVTAFYLIIRLLDSTTGARVPVFTSPNIVGDLVSGSTPGWEGCVIDPPLARVQSQEYEYEFVTVGGNHSIRGISFSDTIPDHPSANIVAIGATRDSHLTPSSPGTIAKADVVSSPNVPWLEAAIDTGNTSTQHDPVTEFLSLSTTIAIPNWAKYVDPVALGKGGTGAAGASFGFYGNPGTPGTYNADTWVRGVDFDLGLDFSPTIITFDPADADTANTVLSIPGRSVTADNGTDGSGTGFGGTPIGKGPGSFTYEDETYVGGDDQKAYGGAGVGPGGAGNGGDPLTGFFTGGGKGANGGGWVRFRPGEGSGVTPPPPPPSIGPPTAPTLITLDGATPASLTVTITGGTDFAGTLVKGAIAATVKPLSAAVTAEQTVSGVLAATLRPLTALLADHAINRGRLAAIVPKPNAHLAGASTHLGTINAVLKSPVAAVSAHRMATTLIGSNNSATTSVTIPAHQVGDIIVLFGYHDGAFPPPTMPSAGGTVPAWIDIDDNPGGNANGSRTAYAVATATNHTSGVWTNASGMIAVVIRGQNATTPIGGHAESGFSATGSSGFFSPSITMSNTTGSSMLLYFYGQRVTTAWSAAPSGYTRQTSNAGGASGGVCLNTKDDTTSDGSATQLATAAGVYGFRSAVVEILH